MPPRRMQCSKIAIEIAKMPRSRMSRLPPRRTAILFSIRNANIYIHAWRHLSIKCTLRYQENAQSSYKINNHKYKSAITPSSPEMWKIKEELRSANSERKIRWLGLKIGP